MRPQRTTDIASSAPTVNPAPVLVHASNGLRVAALFLLACSDHEAVLCPPGTPHILFPGILTVTEGGTTRFLLEFVGGAPTQVVHGEITPEDPSMATTIPKSFRVEPSQYPVTVTLYGVDDGQPNPTNRGTLLGGYTEDCGGNEGNGIAVIDRTVENVLASDWNLLMSPSSTTTFDVTLTQPPPGTVTVTLNTAPAGIVQFAPTSLTLGPTDYNVGHTVTVTSIGTASQDAYVGLHPDNGIQSQAVAVNVRP